MNPLQWKNTLNHFLSNAFGKFKNLTEHVYINFLTVGVSWYSGNFLAQKMKKRLKKCQICICKQKKGWKQSFRKSWASSCTFNLTEMEQNIFFQFSFILDETPKRSPNILHMGPYYRYWKSLNRLLKVCYVPTIRAVLVAFFSSFFCHSH